MLFLLNSKIFKTRTWYYSLLKLLRLKGGIYVPLPFESEQGLIISINKSTVSMKLCYFQD